MEEIVVSNDTIRINSASGSCIIYFADNLDLYLSFIPAKREDNKKYSFDIQKDSQLYQVFDNLYLAIKENKPYKNSTIDDITEIEMPIFRHSDYLGLFVDDKIVWKSDDFPIEEASSLIIEKSENSYIISFEKSSSKTERNTFAVRIRNSGSRYSPYNVPLINFYRTLLTKRDTIDEP